MNERANTLVDQGLQSLETRLRELMVVFRDVLCSIGENDLAQHIPWIDEVPLKVEQGEKSGEIIKVYSIAFQLLDMLEERVAMATRREREKTLGPTAEKGLWPERLKTLKDQGLSEKQIAEVMASTSVEPVFTAHPTEAKGTSVRERHRDIYGLILKLEHGGYTDLERELILSRLSSALEALWFTGQVHQERPTVERELRSALYYLCERFPDVTSRIDLHLAKTWEMLGFQPETLQEAGGGPRLRFGLWIGGDRDGHPFVTADVTRDTLKELRKRALRLHKEELRAMAKQLSVSLADRPAPKALEARTKKLTKELGSKAKRIMRRYGEEPWRAFGHLLALSLSNSAAADTQSLRQDLLLMEESLKELGSAHLAKNYVRPVVRKLDVFGFHLASLDIRQNSAFHDKAAEQLLTVAGVANGETYSEWSEHKRLDFLTQELESARPFLHSDQRVGAEADAVRDCYRVLADHRKVDPKDSVGIGALIVSMTRQASDLLLVHLFARETGLSEIDESGLPVCPLQVVPLFETLEDLAEAASVMEIYLEHPATKRSLKLQDASTQQVMLGYSDSNKDAGILASQVGLRRAQESIVEAGRRYGVETLFFHGRGGTVSRGAGPTEWFVKSLPQGSLHEGLRMTEQGETIASKYAHLASATYNLELLQACTTHGAALQKHEPEQLDPSLELLEPLAEVSQEAYRAFIEKEDFLSFYRQATPIDALEQTQMGSRPARRTGTPSLDDLRAIPWVFSWTQARFYLPGWFGVGSALNQWQAEEPARYEELLATVPKSIFARYVFTNVESSLASADLGLMHAYAALIEDEKVRVDFMDCIESEYKQTKNHLAAIFPAPLAERRPRFHKTLALRNEQLATLHYLQIDLLKEWRREGGPLPRLLLLLVNAISSGLRNTG